MGHVHQLSETAQGGLTGIQAGQRDWSPYLVHLTKWSAMKAVRSLAQEGSPPSVYLEQLQEADRASFDTFEAIAAAGQLHSGSPTDGCEACVCLTECTLPGLIGHAERYGRFGFVFEKAAVYAVGGRPCTYVDYDHYEALKTLKHDHRSPIAKQARTRMLSLANKYAPPNSGHTVQDYTHEREWRVFSSISFDDTPPIGLIVPSTEYVAAALRLLPDLPVFPLRELFLAGA